MKTILVLVVIGCLAHADSDRDDGVAIPDVAGMSRDQAEAKIEALGFTQAIRQRGYVSGGCNGSMGEAPAHPVPQHPKDGTVMCTTPPVGEKLAKNHQLQFIVYYTERLGPAGCVCPDDLKSLVGKPVAEVKATLRKWEFTGTIDFRNPGGFIKGCKLGTVCQFEQDSVPKHAPDATLWLVINHSSIQISTPDP